MKNLLNRLSLEKIEQIPTGRYKGTLRNGVLTSRNWVDWRWSWDNSASDLLFKKMERVIRTSIGQNWNDIYSKLCRMMKGVKFDFSVDWVIKRYVAIPFWNYIEKRWCYHHTYIISYDLYEVINLLKQGKHAPSFNDELIYVCPNTGILKQVKRAMHKVKGKPSFYVSTAKSRAERRLAKDTRGVDELKMINDPILHKYYVSLLNKRISLFKTIYSSPEPKPEIRYYKDYRKEKPIQNPKNDLKQRMTWWRWQEARINDERIKAQGELILLEQKIKALESGDKKSFYQSDYYLSLLNLLNLNQINVINQIL